MHYYVFDQNTTLRHATVLVKPQQSDVVLLVEKYALRWYVCLAREGNNSNDEVMPPNSIQTRFTLSQALPRP